MEKMHLYSHNYDGRVVNLVRLIFVYVIVLP